jgi:FKBP-type peptidyl-prolyl cis-trans isomerase
MLPGEESPAGGDLPAGDDLPAGEDRAETERSPTLADAAGDDSIELELTEGGVSVEDLKPGHGAEARLGQRLTVHYVGRLENGTEFDSSRTRGTPFTFELGSGRVIAGWEEGIAGMRVGGLRRLIIPPHMAYGERGRGEIPPNAILEFDVELIDVE